MTDALDDAATDPRQTIAELQRKLAECTAELTESLERQNATAEILRMIASAPGDAGRSLQLIAETSARLFGAPSVSIQLVKDGEWADAYRLGNSAKSIRVAVPLNQIRVGGRNLPGTVVGQNRQIHIPDLDHLDPSLADFPGLPVARAAGTRTMCGTPLRREGEPIGALIVYRDRLLPFTNEELALQQTFADQAVIAIENARLFNETNEALARQTATSDILRVISQSPTDVQPVFDSIVTTAVRLLHGDLSFLMLCDRRHYWVAAAAAPDGLFHELTLVKEPIDPGINFPSRAIVEKRALYLPDWSLIDLPAHERQIHEKIGVKSALYLPLLRDGECIGLLTVGGKQANIFGENEIALAESFRDQALIAIENVRLFDEVKAKTADLSDSLQQQTATADVLQVIANSVADTAPVFEKILDSCQSLFASEQLGIFLVREGQTHATVWRGTAFEAVSRTFPMPVEETATGLAIRTRSILHIPTTAGMPEMPAAVRNIHDRIGDFTVAWAPMLWEHNGVGSICVMRQPTRAFSEKELALLRTFADQAVIAIQNARLFNEAQMRTKELSTSLDELRTAQDRLVQTEKLASLGQLTAGIAHEIKNPLNFVNNFSALSAELTDELNDALKPVAMDVKVREEVTELTGMLKDNLEKVVQHGKRADSIVKNMLLHSREGSGEQRPADINALLDESLNLAYHGARAEKPGFNITLQRDFDSSAGEIELFPQEITRALLNLISNGFYAASKRKAENGEADFEPILSAATKNLGNQVEIRIRDNGTGIPAEVKEKIFNPFFTTKPAGEGTGLGLSMSHDIVVKQHGGRIEVNTQPGQFTEFTIVLPRSTNPTNNRKS